MIGFPVIFYLLFGVTNKNSVFHGHTIARYLLAGYSCFGAMGSSLFGIGAGLAFERGHGWLEMKRASPMPAAAYLLAKLCVSITFAVAITILLMILGTAMAGVHITIIEGLRLLSVIAAGVLPFASLGLVIGLLMPSNAAPGVINLIYLPTLVLRRLVDADRGVAPLVAIDRAWVTIVLVRPPRARNFRLQR